MTFPRWFLGTVAAALAIGAAGITVLAYRANRPADEWTHATGRLFLNRRTGVVCVWSASASRCRQVDRPSTGAADSADPFASVGDARTP